MATYRNRLSKRQKRRSLKRKNVKSRKVMRGGGVNPQTAKCNANMPKGGDILSPELKQWRTRFGLGPTDDIYTACVTKYGK